MFVESCQTLPNVAGGSVQLVSTGTITQGNHVGYTILHFMNVLLSLYPNNICL